MANRLLGPVLATQALFLSVFNWFNFAYLPRTFSNVFETLLVTLGLSCIHSSTDFAHLFVVMMGMFMSIALRPTILLFWAPIILIWLWNSSNRFGLLKTCIFAFISACTVNFVVDSYFYQHPVFVLYNFFEFNFLKGFSKFYGTHPFHWYLSQALPAMLNMLAPFTVISLIKDDISSVVVVGIPLSAFSLIGHKEIRFLLPLLPFLVVTSCKSLSILGPKLRKLFFIAYFVINMGLGLYMTTFHQHGPIAAAKFLRTDLANDSSLLVLMPCHSIPLQSFLHKDIPIIELSCNPPLDNLQFAHDQDKFFDNPVDETMKYIESFGPSHILLFEALEKDIKTLLLDNSYRKCFDSFHTHIVTDSRRRGNVKIYCKGK